MKKVFLSFSALVFAAGVFFSGCGKDTAADKPQMSRASYYNDLIKDAFTASPKQLGLKLSGEKIEVYGVITEQNVGDLLVLVSAAYSTGEAVEIVYGGSNFIVTGENGTSSGVSALMNATAARYLKYYDSDIEKYWSDKNTRELMQTLLMTLFIDEKNNTEISESVKKFMEYAQDHIINLENVDKDGALPLAGEIKIIFLTNKGRYYVQDKIEKITGSELGALFKKRSNITDMIFKNYAPAPQSR